MTPPLGKTFKADNSLRLWVPSELALELEPHRDDDGLLVLVLKVWDEQARLRLTDEQARWFANKMLAACDVAEPSA